MGKLTACLVFAFFLAPALGAQGNNELRLADAYYDQQDYSRAYSHYQNLILETGVSGSILRRYGYCREQIRGQDEATLKIYTLAEQYREISSPEQEILLLEELREDIEAERRAYLYDSGGGFYRFASQFSVFQWKIIAALAALVPFLIGILVLGRKEGRSRA
jgi:hypothetical protein